MEEKHLNPLFNQYDKLAANKQSDFDDSLSSDDGISKYLKHYIKSRKIKDSESSDDYKY